MIGSRLVSRRGRLVLQSSEYTKEELEQQIEYYERCCGLFLAVTLPSIDLADSAVRDAVDALKKEGLYKQALKKYAQSTLNTLNGISVQTRARVQKAQSGDQTQVYLDYLDIAQDDMQQHVDILKYALSQFALNKGWRKGNLCGTMWLADALFSMAIEIYDHFFIQIRKEYSPMVEKLVKHFWGFAYPLSAARLWAHALIEFNKACNLKMGLEKECVPDFYKDDNVRNAYLAVRQRFVNIERIDRDGNEAYNMNPDAVARVEAFRQKRAILKQGKPTSTERKHE